MPLKVWSSTLYSCIFYLYSINFVLVIYSTNKHLLLLPVVTSNFINDELLYQMLIVVFNVLAAVMKVHTYILRRPGLYPQPQKTVKSLSSQFKENNTVHTNHLQLVYDTFLHHEHGLGLNDVNCRDNQNCEVYM